jgi:TetR/AcrR family transcriptional regulator, transcriptional repressor for nem operon
MQRSGSKKGRESFADRHLSWWHRDNPSDGCTMAVQASECSQ